MTVESVSESGEPSRERVVASTVHRPCRVRNGRAGEKVTVSADVPGHESPQHDGVVRTSYICPFLRHRANSTGVDMALARATRSSERVVGPDRAASVARADVPSRLARAAVAAASSAPTSLRVPSPLLFLASPRQLNESRHDDRQSERRRAESESSVSIAPPPWRAPNSVASHALPISSSPVSSSEFPIDFDRHEAQI